MPDDEQLLGRLGEALQPEPRQPDPARIAALRAAAAARADTSVGADPARRRADGERSRPSTTLLAAAAAIVLVVAVGAVLAFQRNDSTERAGGVVEFETTLRAPDGGATAEVTGLLTDFGRIVELRTGELPILPTGEYYEVWFVGPGDTSEAPNRVSAGTFHPDQDGNTDIVLTAAVDPVKYPEMVVTAEAGDGEPRPSRDEVLRAPIERTG